MYLELVRMYLKLVRMYLELVHMYPELVRMCLELVRMYLEWTVESAHDALKDVRCIVSEAPVLEVGELLAHLLGQHLVCEALQLMEIPLVIGKS